MNIDIDIDFGNLWEALSAIGSLLAVIISLHLATRREKYKELKISQMYFPGQQSNYEIKIFNTGKREVKIIEYGFIEYNFIFIKEKHEIILKRDSRPIVQPPIRRIGEIAVDYGNPEGYEVSAQIMSYLKNTKVVYPHEDVVFETLVNEKNVNETFAKYNINHSSKLKTYVKIDTGDIICSGFMNLEHLYGLKLDDEEENKIKKSI